MQLLRKISLSGSLLLALLLITTIWVGAAAAAPAKVNHLTTVHKVSVSRSSNSNTELLQRMGTGRLAPTVHVLASLPPTTILQFPLVPAASSRPFHRRRAW